MDWFWFPDTPCLEPCLEGNLSSAARDRCLQSLNWEFMGSPFRPIVWTLGSVDPIRAKRISFFGSTYHHFLKPNAPERHFAHFGESSPIGFVGESSQPQICPCKSGSTAVSCPAGKKQCLWDLRSRSGWSKSSFFRMRSIFVSIYFHIFPRSSLWCLSRICSNCTLMLVCSIGAMRPGLCRSKGSVMTTAWRNGFGWPISQEQCQWIGLREKLQESPIFYGGKSMVCCRSSLKPIQWQRDWNTHNNHFPQQCLTRWFLSTAAQSLDQHGDQPKWGPFKQP